MGEQKARYVRLKVRLARKSLIGFAQARAFSAAFVYLNRHSLVTFVDNMIWSSIVSDFPNFLWPAPCLSLVDCLPKKGIQQEVYSAFPGDAATSRILEAASGWARCDAWLMRFTAEVDRLVMAF